MNIWHVEDRSSGRCFSGSMLSIREHQIEIVAVSVLCASANLNRICFRQIQ